MFGRKAKAAPTGDGFDARTRRRLERFAEAFDDVDAGDFVLYAGPLDPDPQLQLAMGDALALLGHGDRRADAKAATDRFVSAAQRRYSERFDVFGLIVGTRRTASAADRVRVYRSLERAVAAVVLWDQLDDTTRSVLVGPWGPVVYAALGDE